MTCISTPVSWMKLEQYHLGELSPAERQEISLHLDNCPACAACAKSITDDHRALPPLPAPEAAPSLITLPRIVFATVAAAAAMVVALLLPPSVFDGENEKTGHVAYRGGETALTIARERNGRVVENPEVYLSGDRFRLFATVAGKGEQVWDVVVFQGDEVFFPLTPVDAIGPGNNIPLAGAFRVDGEAAIEICLMVGERVPSRDVLRREGRKALLENAVCRTIESAKE